MQSCVCLAYSLPFKGRGALSISLCVIRSCKIALVSAIALFFTAVVADNLTDYGSNWQFVQHVLSMDTTFSNSKLHWRAINDPVIQQGVYWLIIATQFITAALLWLGALRLLVMIGTTTFRLAKTLAVAGLTLGLLLYIVGFVTVGGEWFAMWQSATWNGQEKAFSFIAMTAAVLIVLLMPEEAE